jgi:hypothetical protein
LPWIYVVPIEREAHKSADLMPDRQYQESQGGGRFRKPIRSYFALVEEFIWEEFLWLKSLI